MQLLLEETGRESVFLKKCKEFAQALGSLPLPNPEWALFWDPLFRSQWAPVEVRGPLSKHGFPEMALVCQFGPFFGVKKKHESLKIRKKHLQQPVDRPKTACSVRHAFLGLCFSPQENCTS